MIPSPRSVVQLLPSNPMPSRLGTPAGFASGSWLTHCLLSAGVRPMSRLIDLTGMVFGKWTVIEKGPIGENTSWKCRCECGSVRLVKSHYLRNGRSKHCGCTQWVKHGMSKTPEWTCWQNMIHRCERVKHPEYIRYGARGITVCERWRTSFENFLEDMGVRPSKEHSIDRVDTNGNYCKSNCRWATKKTQAQNTRRNRLVTYKGETKCVSEWSRTLGIPASGLRLRILSGWSADDAIETPFTECPPRMMTLDGVTKSLSEWSRLLGINSTTLSQRANYGWSDERILTTPVTNHKKYGTDTIVWNGESKLVSTWAKQLGITNQALKWRIKNWTLERAMTTAAEIRDHK
jgi:hypothetical protein